MKQFVLNTDQKREEIWLILYEEVFPSVATFVAKNGGNLDEAKDVFQDALISFYERQSESEISDVNAYIYGASRFLWYKRFGDINKFNHEEMASDIVVTAIDEPTPSEKTILVSLEFAGKKCLELLKSFYYDKLSMSAIATKFGFNSERSATVQKFKCLEKVREGVKQKNMIYEDFLE